MLENSMFSEKFEIKIFYQNVRFWNVFSDQTELDAAPKIPARLAVIPPFQTHLRWPNILGKFKYKSNIFGW